MGVHQGGDRTPAISQRPNETLARLHGASSTMPQRATAAYPRSPSATAPRHARAAPPRHTAVGLLATDDDPRCRTLDALGGVVAIAIERAPFLREKGRRVVAAAGGLRGGAPRVVRPRPAHAADRGARRGRQPAGTRRSRRRTAGQARLALSEARAPDAPVSGHPRHGAHRRGRDHRRAPMGDARRHRRRGAGATRRLVADRRSTSMPDGETEVYVDPRLTSSALAHLVENAARTRRATARSKSPAT